MWHDETPVQLVRDTLLVVLKIAGPILLVGVIIGLVISLIQSVTSIQDQTIVFVPKVVGMVLVAAFLLPWITMRLVDFTREMLLLF
ncbi:MAG: flagellar biosynthetic protein FliQ [Planctomycetota bacterium]